MSMTEYGSNRTVPDKVGEKKAGEKAGRVARERDGRSGLVWFGGGFYDE